MCAYLTIHMQKKCLAAGKALRRNGEIFLLPDQPPGLTRPVQMSLGLTMTMNYKHIKTMLDFLTISLQVSQHFKAYIIKAPVMESNSNEIFSVFSIIIKLSCRGKVINMTHLALKNTNWRANKIISKAHLESIIFKVRLVIFSNLIAVF